MGNLNENSVDMEKFIKEQGINEQRLEAVEGGIIDATTENSS